MGLVSPPLREGALLLFALFCAGLGALTLFPSGLWSYLLQPESAPALVLAEGRRGGRPGLALEPPLVLHSREGGDTPALRRIYFRDMP